MRRKVELKPWMKRLIIVGIIFLVVTISGVIASGFNAWNFVFLESFYLMTGAIFMLIALFNARSRENKNYKENKSIVEDESKQEYKEYKSFQRILWISGIVYIVLSLITFAIFIN